ncbi:ABC transporter permease [Clostridium oryzae]|uniref:Macrolide export ATP-binding/permease protein MacB n=1 Tax=Clostridium oryzae TaxID=1450648 RepID=A0A1V4IH58_9CLOT|nr:FtsX-like permease family protein [Clostridium oryzae]OPJ59332.1 macrolide export ATP-binding/permease protein MacB [Clostridium oryzae]
MISVAASCALFLASNGVAQSYKTSYINMLRSSIGDADITVTAKSNQQSPYITTNRISVFRDRIQYAVGEINGTASYEINPNENVSVSLVGVDYNDLMMINPVNLLTTSGIKPFTGNKIIISENTAEKYGYTAGDKIKITFNNNKETFNVTAIAQQTSLFMGEQRNIIGIIPKETMCKLNGQLGKVDTIYVKAKNNGDVPKLISSIKSVYKNCDVKVSIDQEEVSQSLQMITVPFDMMLLVVLIMSIFIIYTAFKMIVIERMPIIGTFRSIGATKRVTNSVLIIESIIYGFFGGIVGDALGIVILYVVAVVMNPYKNYFTATLHIDAMLPVWTLLFGVFVSFISSVLPIKSASKISVKDIVLNRIDDNGKISEKKTVIGLILGVLSIIVPRFNIQNQTVGILVGAFSMVSIVIAVVMAMPLLSNIFSFLIKYLYALFFGNEGELAIKNIRDNKNIINNICLMSIGISALLMINVISLSVAKEVSKAYGAYNSNIIVGPNYGDSTHQNIPIVKDTDKIAAMNGVSGTAGVYEYYNAKVELNNGKEGSIMCLQAIAVHKFARYINVDFQNGKGVPRNFDDSRNILIAAQLKKILNVNNGDYITFNVNDKKKSYRIVGVFDTLMENGNYAIIPERYMKNDFGSRKYSMIFVRTYKNENVVAKNIKQKYKKQDYYVETLASMEKRNDKSNAQMMSQLKPFPLISLIIGAFGVINNFLISFIERKRSFAVMASIGMSRMQNIKLLLIEGLTTGIIGGITGIITGYIMTTTMPLIMRILNFSIPMHYSASLFVMSFILSVAINLAASAVPAIKSSKLNIIESIKFE